MPTALAYATCAFLLEDTQAAGTSTLPNGASIALFSRPDSSTIAVLWADEATTVTIAEDVGEFALLDIMSNPRSPTARTLTLTPEPLFVSFPKAIRSTVFGRTPP